MQLLAEMALEGDQIGTSKDLTERVTYNMRAVYELKCKSVSRALV